MRFPHRTFRLNICVDNQISGSSLACHDNWYQQVVPSQKKKKRKIKAIEKMNKP